MRKIPATMATQHPDNAAAPYWDKVGRPFISAYQEIAEAAICFDELGVSEYMWDWEGKHADATVIDRLFSDHHDYFVRNQLGADKFLTFRIPNVWEEKGYNLMQAMSVILSAEDFARDLKFKQRPLFEVILPMTERADQLMHMSRLFEKLAHFKSADFTSDLPPNTDYLEMIPLVESVDSQLKIGELLTEYVTLHKKYFKRQPEYIRAFLACSDSALSSGFLPAVLGNKLGLARLYEFAERNGIPMYPIAGSGSLPFRGGLSPRTVERFVQELPGMRTVSVQSAFRYDYPADEVKKAIKKLEAALPKARPLSINAADQKVLQNIALAGGKIYKQTVQRLTQAMQPVFKAVPKRRDRRQHIGLVSYSRSMGGQSLPRAITFTGGFYSIGVPPEFIGLGRLLQQFKPAELAILKKHYSHLESDLMIAGRYLNRENLTYLAGKSTAWAEIENDVLLTEKILNLKFGPESSDELSHQKLTSAALTLIDETPTLSDLISKMALLRKSIG